MRIDAAVLNEPGAIEVTSLSLDEPRDDEVLVDIAAAGVCHSDYDQYVSGTDGPCPMVLGHEGAGVVEATGEDVTGVERGDHVVLAVMPFCGMCRYCESGRLYLCERGNDVAFAGTMMDGTRRLSDDGPVNHFFAQSSFATKAVVHESAAVPVDEDVPLEEWSTPSSPSGTPRPYGRVSRRYDRAVPPWLPARKPTTNSRSTRWGFWTTSG